MSNGIMDNPGDAKYGFTHEQIIEGYKILKEKGAKYVSGFRTLNHPEKYDKAYISLDMRNQCFTYALILFLGAILSYFISAIIAIPTYVLWGILFFKSVHLDAEKAFEKYLIK